MNKGCFTTLLSILMLFCFASSSAAQSTKEISMEEINHEVQLYLLIASRDSTNSLPLPSTMEPVVTQLKATLPFANYRLATSFLNRVRDGGDLNVSGVGSPLTPIPTNSNNPTFYNFGLKDVRINNGANGRTYIRVKHFSFGLRVPVVSAITPGEGGKAGYPVVNYEQTGINTEMSIGEGVPTIVGTLTTSQPNEVFVLVISIQRPKG
jgi:hypothetical protein